MGVRLRQPDPHHPGRGRPPGAAGAPAHGHRAVRAGRPPGREEAVRTGVRPGRVRVAPGELPHLARQRGRVRRSATTTSPPSRAKACCSISATSSCSRSGTLPAPRATPSTTSASSRWWRSSSTATTTARSCCSTSPTCVRMNAIARAMISLHKEMKSAAEDILTSAISAIEDMHDIDTPAFQFERVRSLNYLKATLKQIHEKKDSPADALKVELQSADRRRGLRAGGRAAGPDPGARRGGAAGSVGGDAPRSRTSREPCGRRRALAPAPAPCYS